MAITKQSRLDLAASDPVQRKDLNIPIPMQDDYLEMRLGRDYQKYRELRRDTHVRSRLAKRYRDILGRKLNIDGGSDKAKEIVEQIIKKARYESMCAALLDSGQLIGFSVLKLDWHLSDDGKLLYPTWEFVRQDRFIFDYHRPERRDIPVCTNEPLDPATDIVVVGGYELRILTQRSSITGERCPKDRFLLYTFGSLESPWGLGLGYSIYPWTVIKREARNAWLMHSDRIGANPPIAGFHPPGDGEDFDAVLAKFDGFLKAVSPNAWGRFPQGFEAKVMDALQGANTDVHEKLIGLANDEISKVVLGEVPYSDKDTGSYAANASQVTERSADLDADCNLLDEQLDERFWEIVRRLNYDKEEAPIIRRETIADMRTKELEQQKNLVIKERFERDLKARELGYQVQSSKITEIYGEEYEPIAAAGIDGSQQALVTSLGVGGTQALISFLQALPNLGFSRDNVIASLTSIFGLSKESADQIIPEGEAAPGQPGAQPGPAPDQTVQAAAIGGQPAQPAADVNPNDLLNQANFSERVPPLSDSGAAAVQMIRRKLQREKASA